MRVDEHEDHEATEAKWEVVVDEAARLYLGISGDEFLARLRDGDTEGFDHVRLMRVRMLVPREHRARQDAA